MRALQFLVVLAAAIVVPGVIPGAPPALPGKDSLTVTGVLRRVALTDREIIVVGPGDKGPATETTIAAPADVRVLRDGKVIQFAELKEGDSVTVSVEKLDGRWTASTIQIGAAAPVARKAKVVPRIRMILRIADGILQQMEKKDDR